jgi:hypothetical protein
MRGQGAGGSSTSSPRQDPSENRFAPFVLVEGRDQSRNKIFAEALLQRVAHLGFIERRFDDGIRANLHEFSPSTPGKA